MHIRVWTLTKSGEWWRHPHIERLIRNAFIGAANRKIYGAHRNTTKGRWLSPQLHKASKQSPAGNSCQIQPQRRLAAKD
jgi:hypothetical protein